jgi:feruloyl-CoA synthase
MASSPAQALQRACASLFEAPDVEARPLPAGGLLLRSRVPLAPSAPSLGAHLRRQAARRPEQPFLAERAGEAWRKITYAEALAAAERLGQALLNRGLSAERPLMILSGNSIEHALLMLAGHLAGVAVAPVSPAYSLMSRDFGKLRHVFELVRPGLLYAAPLEPYALALAALDLAGVEVITRGAVPAGLSATPLETLLDTAPGRELEAAAAAVGPQTVAKYLFTSGSTGLPKGVINTHGMLCASQQMLTQVWPFVADAAPVLVDWLPWNHTFGGNHNFNLVLAQGGTLYIDGGRPLPGQIEQTVANLREVAPTIYYNVPAGYAQLVPFLEQDALLRDRFFSRMQVLFYAAAALPHDLWRRLHALAEAAGAAVIMTSAWGSTETAPMATVVHYPLESADNIGVPAPGVEIKLVPSGSKLEMRVRGPNVTPGYLKREDLTRAAFDEEGFYRIGDAGRLADATDPNKGLIFDGRVAEDFKLTSGTWVHAGKLRVASLSATAPCLQDAVVTGHDREYVGLLAWPNVEACRKLAGDTSDPADVARLIRHPEVIARICSGLAAHNAESPGSSTRIRRVLLMREPPQVDAHEITDKGYINQRATLEHRAALVERLYAEPPAADVIIIA